MSRFFSSNFEINFDSFNEQAVYEAIRTDDLVGAVLIAQNFIRNEPYIFKQVECLLRDNKKNEYRSHTYRKIGNLEYSKEKYQEALILYNKALLCAPHGSTAMALAYSNRSALLFKGYAFSSCLNDIETCFSIGCPSEVIDKLHKRKEKAMICLELERFALDLSKPPLFDKFFKLKNIDPEAPNVSSDIKITMEPDGPKVVAAKNIDVGNVLALETPFVSSAHTKYFYISCFYCLKISYNLIPCHGCRYALFCSMSCMQRAMEDGHKVFCSIQGIFKLIAPECMLAPKAVVKMRFRSNSWEDFIAEFNESDGSNGRNTVNDIFNENKLFWLESNNDDKHFIVGRLFQSCMVYAIIIQYLDMKTDFFPHSIQAKQDAIRTVCKIMMSLSQHASTVFIRSAVNSKHLNCVMLLDHANYALLSFTGTLKNSCVPNVLPVFVNNSIVLLSVLPIKKDTELTISLPNHFLHENVKKYLRPRLSFISRGVICTCIICNGDWITRRQTLTSAQAKAYRRLDVDLLELDSVEPGNMHHVYKKICKVLNVVGQTPLSIEYERVFFLLCRCLLAYQVAATGNKML